jgi:hypothetical protein
MVFRPTPCPSRWEGLAVSLWIVLLDVLFVVWAIRREADALKFVLIVLVVASLPLLVHFLYRTWSAFTLEYWVDRNAITVRWANIRQIIPLPTIERIIHGREYPQARGGWGEWPAPYLRSDGAASQGRVQVLATMPPEDCIWLDTHSATFALSPSDPEGFQAAIQERYAMGPAQIMSPARQHVAVLGRMAPSDRFGAWLLFAGMLGVLVLFGVLMLSFTNLPDVLTVRYNSAGLPEEIREKAALFRLPTIGLIVWIINGALGLWLNAQKQPIGAYMLWGGAIVVEVFSLVALVSLIT